VEQFAVVAASGGFDTEVWASTGITYHVELDSSAPAAALSALLDPVDRVAEIPRDPRRGPGPEVLTRYRLPRTIAIPSATAAPAAMAVTATDAVVRKTPPMPASVPLITSA
jgi:hypothetical protein